MMPHLLIFVAMFIAVTAAPPLSSRVDALNTNRIDSTLPADIPDFPSQVFDFLTSLPEVEKTALARIYVNQATGMYRDNEILAEVREKAPVLYWRTLKLSTEIEESFKNLGVDAKAFLSEIDDELKLYQAETLLGRRMTLETFMTKFNAGVMKYKDLSEAAKADLSQQFPGIMSFLKNDKVYALMERSVGRKINGFAQLLTELKEAMPQMHERIMKLSAEMVDSYHGLGEEAMTFLSAIAEENRQHQEAMIAGHRLTVEAIMAKIYAGVDKYKALSDSAKADLDRQFPVVMAFLKHPKIIVLVKRALEGKI